MNDTQERLIRCFSTVFPGLSRNEILQASSASTPGWDSLAMVTLLAVIEEEFGVQFPPHELEALVSFDSFSSYMTGLPTRSGTSNFSHVP